MSHIEWLSKAELELDYLSVALYMEGNDTYCIWVVVVIIYYFT